MVLKEKYCMAWFCYNLLHNGLERKWSWKKLPCTELSINLAIMVRFGWNFDTIWVPIKVTSGVNCCCLPALLWELSQIVCVFNTARFAHTGAQWAQYRFGFENLNFNGWNLFWLCLDGIEARMLDLWGFMQWSWKELKWSWKNHICPYFDCVACNFNKKRSNGLERNSSSSPFAMWMLYQSKNGCFVQGNDLTAYGWAYTSQDPHL